MWFCLAALQVIGGGVVVVGFVVARWSTDSPPFWILLPVMVLGMLLMWLGKLVLADIPYEVSLEDARIVLVFLFRRDEIPASAVESYRYLFVLGGQLGGFPVAFVRLVYRANSLALRRALVLLRAEGEEVRIPSPKNFNTQLDRVIPYKRAGLKPNE